MKYLKRWNQLRESKKMIETIDSICKIYNIKNYSINKDGSIDVNGDVNLFERRLTKLPLKFGKVIGDFCCEGNQLTSLEGSPEIVGFGFYCSKNKLTTLKGGPIEVGGNYDCSNNQLVTLEGAPDSLDGSFICYSNKLNTLIGAPSKVSYFSVRKNNLISLEGAPECDNFDCGENPVWFVWKLFNKDRRLIEKLNGMYTGSLSPFIIKDGVNYLRGDILEEIADELDVTLPTDWSVKVERAGYTVI